MLLFLDLEGVTHPILDTPFNRDNMQYLERLLNEHPEVSIVITSSLREEYSLVELRDMLGAIIGPRIVGMTPVIHDDKLSSIRYREVMRYLELTNNSKSEWLALDDPPKFDKGRESSVVFTDPNLGLTEEDYLKIKMRLNKIGA